MRHLRWLLVACLVMIPVLAYALDLTSEGGFVFDVRDNAGGQLNNGSSDAYDGAYFLVVDGVTYNTGVAGTTTLEGRNIVLADVTMADLTVHREIYVPEVGGDYARFLDVLSNTTEDDISVTVALRGDLGSDGDTTLYQTSSGDTALTVADGWFATDDGVDGFADPALAHIFQGEIAREPADTVTLTGQNFRWEFVLTIPAGETMSLLSFGVQKDTRAEAIEEAVRLAELPEEALIGLDSATLMSVVNHSILEPGAPLVTFGGPLEMDEGDEPTISVSVTDPEDDDVEWAWDLDDDGDFDESANVDEITLSDLVSDGPGFVRVGVEASDGSHASRRFRSIVVRNVTPEFASEPPSTSTSVSAQYVYNVEVNDPAGEEDPITYRLIEGPDDMEMSVDGQLTWRAGEEDITEPDAPVHVEIEIDDGDDGTARQEWDLIVLPNEVPTDPVPLFPRDGNGLLDLSPRLVVSNSSDPDFDPVTYFFEIDVVDTFDSENLRASGEIAEQDAITAWTVDPELDYATSYHWRVWASDSKAETVPVVAQFFVVENPDAVEADAGSDAGADSGESDGGDEGGGGGGCSLASRSASPTWLMLTTLALARARRFRRRRVPR